MQIRENVSLRPLNTFGIAATARYFAEAITVKDLEEICNDPLFIKYPSFVLGGGSNILLTGNFNGLVIKTSMPGIAVVKTEGHDVIVRAGAGENWHGFVIYCIGHGYGGIENLSLIPGNIGASPMQNIGAYGVEVKDTVETVEAFSIEGRRMHVFTNSECRFGYRDSIFKQEARGKYIITAVNYRLTTRPKYNTSYGAINEELERMGVKELSLEAVSRAVINIRRSKLPDPAEIGNAGSFFKNPVIPRLHYDELKLRFEEIPGYPQEAGYVKVPAGWLIEKLGWKGKRAGETGVHAKQALVLVNYGNAKGKEIFDLSQSILESVRETFGIELEREVNII